MPPIIIVDNEYITVQFLPEKGIIHHTVHKPVDDQSLKDALNAGTDALAKYRACKWLSDDRNNGPISPEMLEWGTKNWDVRTIAAGWKYWANVVPQHIADAGSLIPVIDALFQLGLRMAVFTDLETAFAWLDRLDC